MKRYTIIALCILLTGATSCKKFLEEKPRDNVTPQQFYKTEKQLSAAVDGAYVGLANPYISLFLGLSVADFLSIESITGYATRPGIQGVDEGQFQYLSPKVETSNGYVYNIWKNAYLPLENCNSVIANISATTIVDDATKNKYLGQVYFLRAYHYFNLVRYFGDVPLKTLPTKSSDNFNVPRNHQEAVYDQIVSDLLAAEATNLPVLASDASGHVTSTAVKAMLAKVYLTMAGFPLNKGAEYYQKAYDKAKELIDGKEASLFTTYEDIRLYANKNKAENIFMVQRDAVANTSLIHYTMLPYQGDSGYSKVSENGGGLAPDQNFYDSYTDDDVRKGEKQFFYIYPYPNTTKTTLTIYKYWDQAAAGSGNSGENIPLIRYPDVLLTCAEAKANLDGGSTTDATAVAAYNAVHTRAIPAGAKTTITTEDVLRERFWEFCYENQTWFDMIRTRKALDVPGTNIVNLIGYKAPQHTRAFEEADLLLPLPLQETQNNPELSGPVQ
ncbi:MAG: RagB/SusD family nutrient uptake outer membrane protein [Sphingobacteriaceae bacterium]|nr:MAG: RagB/SusD family nutrient uptake outer membrane protein [Sphingobacteriaceae bacterium]